MVERKASDDICLMNATHAFAAVHADARSANSNAKPIPCNQHRSTPVTQMRMNTIPSKNVAAKPCSNGIFVPIHVFAVSAAHAPFSVTSGTSVEFVGLAGMQLQGIPMQALSGPCMVA
jgi:hypothetical protein